VTDQSRWSDAQKSAYRQMLAKEDDLRASAAQELLDSTELETEVGESLRRDVETAKIAAQTAEQSEAFERDARETMRYASALTWGTRSSARAWPRSCSRAMAMRSARSARSRWAWAAPSS